jgi:NAD(P)-dependent dehydrogenase (short-subunit alcohol dehydrogenase family)
MRRFGSASELADVVAFLAGPRSAYVTGQTLRVDGGYSV